jgi:hypothetical protein
MPVTVGVELAAASARLTDGEVGAFAIGRLAFRTGQGCTNQPSVHRTFVLGGGFGLGARDLGSLDTFRTFGGRRSFENLTRGLGLFLIGRQRTS